jgi:hypothetical protein
VPSAPPLPAQGSLDPKLLGVGQFWGVTGLKIDFHGAIVKSYFLGDYQYKPIKTKL